MHLPLLEPNQSRNAAESQAIICC